MKYLIVSAQSSKELEEKINAMLQDGWQCQGGLSMPIVESNMPIFMQALIYK